MKCCDLNSGMLRHKVTLERETLTTDSIGGDSSSWSTLAADVFTMIKPVSGNERFQAMRLETNLTHTIFMRYRSDLTTKDRIDFNGRKFQIRFIKNVEERNKWLEIKAEEGPVN